MILRIEHHKSYELNQIFSLIEKLVWDDGGDGDCSVFSSSCAKLADLYDKYRQETFGKRYIRENIADFISFSDQSNEGISFHDFIDVELEMGATNKVYIDGLI